MNKMATGPMPARTCEVGPASARLALDLVRGDSVALLGEAGAGKTAWLQALLQGAADWPAEPPSMAMMSGREALRTDRCVAEILVLGLPRGQSDAAARVARWLAVLGLSKVAGQFPARLGTDAMRRTALGRALVGEPALLLLDEPFCGCEPDERRRLAEALRLLQQRHGFSMILATRQAAEARALAARVLVLRQGWGLQQGPMVEVYERPQSAYAARCLGEVNFLPGRLVDEADGVARVILADGAEVEAMLADAVPGQDCLIALRPERIALAAVPAEEMGEGAVAARVERLVHHGDHVELVASVAGTRVSIRRPPGREPAPGEIVSIAWQTAHASACAHIE